MTTFYLNPIHFEKWLHQNKGFYSGEFVEGCLLDNFVIATKRGFAAVYEHYLNPNSSDYRIEFQPGAAQDVFANWYEFEDREASLAASIENQAAAAALIS